MTPVKTIPFLDPACGTAGCLISAFKHIGRDGHRDHYRRDNACVVSTTTTSTHDLTPDERKKIIQNFTGYDISPDMVRLSLVNLYLHGFSDPHIWEYDSLSSEERWDETFDVILANPPFMSPKGGIRPHKKFSISSNRSEVLFVDYIAEHLNPKGRAGIIVPEGVIFQSGTAYKDLRKMLIDNYLYAVVSLPAGVFNPYSGVKTSVLLMDKELAKKNHEILFVKIDNDGFGLGAQRNTVKGGQLEEAVKIIHDFITVEVETRHALSLQQQNDLSPATGKGIAHVVSKKEIAKNGDYNLSGERYKIEEILNSNFDLIELGEICEMFGGGTPSKANDSFWNNGNIRWISSRHIDNSGNIIGNNWITERGLENSSSKIAPKNSLIFITRVSVGKHAIANDDYAINQDLTALIPKDERLSNKYLYTIAPMISGIIDKVAVGIGVRGVNRKQLSEIKIPLPPLSIQEEIVAEIGGYQKIIDGAKAVVENYKPKIDIDPDWEMVEFENAPFEMIDGDRGNNYPNGDDFSSEGYCLFLNTKNVRENGFRFDELMFINKEKDELLRKGKLKRHDVLLTTRGTIGNTACYSDSIKYDHIRINSGMLIFRPNSKLLFPEYLYYFFNLKIAKVSLVKLYQELPSHNYLLEV